MQERTDGDGAAAKAGRLDRKTGNRHPRQAGRLAQGASATALGRPLPGERPYRRVNILPYLEQESMFALYKNLGGNDSTGPRYGSGTNPDNVTRRRLAVLT